MYIISGRAQAVLSAVVESILEECLQDAENSASAAGKSCVTPEETEKALRKLCLRLNAQPSTPGKQKVNTQHEDAWTEREREFGEIFSRRYLHDTRQPIQREFLLATIVSIANKCTSLRKYGLFANSVSRLIVTRL